MANDFSADSNCISLYRFEDPNLLVDSKGSNTLTNPGSFVTATATQFKEGSTSALFEAAGGEYLYRTDANLGSTFPLKSGTSNKTISIAQWFRIVNALPGVGTQMILSGKWIGTSNARSFLIYAPNDGTNVIPALNLGQTDGTFSQQILHASALSLDTWYHLTAGYRDSDKAYRIFLRDTAGNTIGSDISGTATNNIGVFSGSDFMLGTFGTGAAPAGSYLDGYMDEVVVFSKLLTATDATNIAKGLYSGTGDSGGAAPAVSDTATIAEDVKMHMPISLKMMKLP